MTVETPTQPSTPSRPADELVDCLADAAADAVRARHGAIEAGGAAHLRGITVAIETANGGAVLDVTSYLSWKRTIRRTS